MRSKLKQSGRGGLDKHWHLATDDFEVGVTELEFSIFRIAAAFERWQGDCLGCCHGQSFSGHSDSKKDVTYQVSSQGREITDRYARFRRELLISMARTTAGHLDFENLARALTLMAAIYDQASCIAATHRVPL